jgi:hypothetical protein
MDEAWISPSGRRVEPVGEENNPPQAFGPTSEQKAVLGRYALGKPGDCVRPDNEIDGTMACKSQ